MRLLRGLSCSAVWQTFEANLFNKHNHAGETDFSHFHRVALFSAPVLLCSCQKWIISITASSGRLQYHWSTPLVQHHQCDTVGLLIWLQIRVVRQLRGVVHRPLPSTRDPFARVPRCASSCRRLRRRPRVKGWGTALSRKQTACATAFTAKDLVQRSLQSAAMHPKKNKSRGFTAIWRESGAVNRGLGQKSYLK